MADETVGGVEQFAAHPGIGDERPHQQEHRNHAERIVGHRAHRGLADHFERRGKADEVAEAGDADEAHRHSHRHAQQHQREQRDKSEDGDGVGAHAVYSTGLILGSSCISSGLNIRRQVRIAISSTAAASPAHATAKNGQVGMPMSKVRTLSL